ncbi:MAG: MarR family transcriptional regulator [Gemmatimonadaceae bacterium]|nr:MarR family transcriptional regulator [Gemmatimonadaceae bacterium]
MLTPAQRFRRFARAVTTEVGALDQSFLGRGRPLGAARVLNAVGHGQEDVTALRQYLRLDSGLMSRLLRSLEDEGLVTVTADPEDGRRRTVALTAAGRREFRAYETLSNARARAALARYPHRERLLAALDLVATVLAADQVTVGPADPDGEAAQYCLAAYYAEVNERFANGFDVAQSVPPSRASLVAPLGTFLVAMSDGLPLGCVGVVGDGSSVAEIKRLWVAPAARGLGLGRRLMEEAEEAARTLGIHTLRLDTNEALTEARALYKRSGWVEIPRYNENPYAHWFFEKTLARRSARRAK